MAMPMPTLLLLVLLLVLLLAGAAAQQQNRVEPLAACGRDEQPVAKAGVQTVRCDAGTPQFPERRIGYTLAVPEHCALAGGGCGVIMDVHGFTMSADEQEICDDMRVRGNAAGFIVLQPSAPVNPEQLARHPVARLVAEISPPAAHRVPPPHRGALRRR